MDHALQMNKFEVEKDTIGDIIILPREQAVLMTYYRNNIAHMLVLPSLMAAIVTQHRHISRDVCLDGARQCALPNAESGAVPALGSRRVAGRY
ncbi:hypothetical protein ACLBR5_30970 [Escherichia coli]